ncbi:MAG: hypothetical protein AAF517_09200 [Planctomycetota bacterium]
MSVRLFPTAREEWYLAQLRTGSMETKVEAVEQLHTMGSLRAYPYYLEALQSETLVEPSSAELKLREVIAGAIAAAPPSVAERIADASLVDGSVGVAEHLTLKESRQLAVRRLAELHLREPGGDRFRILVKYRAVEVVRWDRRSDLGPNRSLRIWYTLLRLIHLGRESGGELAVREELVRLFDEHDRADEIGELILSLAPFLSGSTNGILRSHLLVHPEERVRLRMLSTLRYTSSIGNLDGLHVDPSAKIRARMAALFAACSGCFDVMPSGDQFRDSLRDDDLVERTSVAVNLFQFREEDSLRELRDPAYRVLLAFPPGPYDEHAPDVGLTREEAMIQFTRAKLYELESVFVPDWEPEMWDRLEASLQRAPPKESAKGGG